MASRSALVTVLFTDIVGSTEIASELGDRSWRELRGRHHQTIRSLLRRFGGREVDTAGDGFFATFDRPTQAVRCAVAACEAVRDLGLELRAGVHVGEVEQTREEKVGGIAVHLGARISARAETGEVLVSDTVRQLIRGSGITLEDRGVHALKGVPESQALFSVAEVDGKRLPPPLDDDEARGRRNLVVSAPIARRRRPLVAAGAAVLAAAVATVALVTGREPGVAPPAEGPPVGTVVRIDPQTNQVVEQIPGLVSRNLAFSPPRIEVGEGGLWVMSGQSDLRHVDPSTGDVTAIEVGGEVDGIALGHGRLWATVGRHGPGQLVAISPGTLRLDQEHDLEEPVAHRGFLVAVTDDAVWAASQGSLTRIDPITGEQRTLAVRAPEDDIVGVGDDLWLVDRFGNRLSRLDTQTNAIVETIALENTPDEVAAGDDGDLWILDEFEWTLTPLSSDGELGRAIPVGEEPLAVVVGEDAVWVGGRDNKVRRIDPAIDSVVATIDVGAPVQALDVDPETGDIWVYLASGPAT